MNVEQNSKLLVERINKSVEFVQSLNYEKFYFKSLNDGATDAGKELTLGFMCYGLKFYFMTNLWSNINNELKTDWVNIINSYQVEKSQFPKNSYIDPNYIKFFNSSSPSVKAKNFTKSFLTLTKIKNYESQKEIFKRSINAETKQAISTLYELGYKNSKPVEPRFLGNKAIEYLDALDWSKPWASGAQFSSFCVFAETQKNISKSDLINFSDNLVNKETGFYYRVLPNEKRELFNGAMKIISGLDWLNYEIHYPTKIIDYCLNNKPEFEGCDFVDFIYILSKCLESTNYRKKDVINLMLEISEDMELLYFSHTGGYSYFKNKSQTNYYNIKISEGLDVPDLHATLLCNWANILILNTIGESNGFKSIKP
tara:strand:- start:26 stop:1132 length:1107 start_codon:yes stop_codon:yes gene_type:complete